MKIYFDSNIFIYTIEGTEIWETHLTALYSNLQASQDQLITSQITKLECLRQPMRSDNIQLIRAYREMFSHEILTLIPINEDILTLTLNVFKLYNLKLADAIHIAALNF